MTDLVKRLRRGDTSPHANCRLDCCMCAIMDEAADEIEKLQEIINQLVDTFSSEVNSRYPFIEDIPHEVRKFNNYFDLLREAREATIRTRR